MTRPKDKESKVMFRTILVPFALIAGICPAFCQQTFSSYDDYCKAMVYTSTPLLIAKLSVMSKSEALKPVQEMTDSSSIKMVTELVEFAYGYNKNSKLESLQNELLNKCMAKQIFVQ